MGNILLCRLCNGNASRITVRYLHHFPEVSVCVSVKQWYIFLLLEMSMSPLGSLRLFGLEVM